MRRVYDISVAALGGGRVASRLLERARDLTSDARRNRVLSWTRGAVGGATRFSFISRAPEKRGRFEYDVARRDRFRRLLVFRAHDGPERVVGADRGVRVVSDRGVPVHFVLGQHRRAAPVAQRLRQDRRRFGRVVDVVQRANHPVQRDLLQRKRTPVTFVRAVRTRTVF